MMTDWPAGMAGREEGRKNGLKHEGMEEGRMDRLEGWKGERKELRGKEKLREGESKER